MTEGLVGAALGGEDPDREGEISEGVAHAATGAEAFAAAIAAIASRQDPGVARKTEEFLVDQSRLVKIQAKHLEDEHALRLAHLRNQLSEERIRRFALHLRVAFQLFVALAATVIGAGILVMLRDAFTSSSVVVEPFGAPPALQDRGFTGKVIAGGLLDELRRLQAATRADAAKRNLSNAWTGAITLAVPEAGISFAEISRILKARFGHDLHIDGDLVQSADGGLALTVRGDGVAPKTFSGSSAELDKLTAAAAGYVYAQSEPVLWAYYLLNEGRNEEAVSFSRAAVAGADPSDRPYLLNTWANATAVSGGMREALPLYRAALALKPDYWVAHNNVINALWALGQEEAAWQAGQQMLHVAGGRPGRAPETYYQNVDDLDWNLGPWLKSSQADADASGGVGSNVGTTIQISIADIDVRLHDLAAAEITLQTISADSTVSNTVLMSHYVRGRIAAEAGDAATAAAELAVFATKALAPEVTFSFPGFGCWVAPAEEAVGHSEKADAVLKATGTFVDCYRFRADILDGRGDWVGARQVYADAVALAPDLPAAFYSWGMALARHGDLAGAAAKLREANRRGPHWADPLKGWADVLLKQGHAKEALAKYDEALKYAPNWGALKAAREAAVKHRT